MKTYYFDGADRDHARPYSGPGMVEAPAGEIEDFVECFYCESRVHVELARDTNAGWICDDCRENLS